jgi:hypothetical protein
MNPGYLSWLLMVISVILFASGWKEVLIRGITSKVILLFFVSWFIGMSFTFAIPGGSIAFSVVILLFIIGGALWQVNGIMLKLHAISIGILLGSVSFFMLETVQMTPVLLYRSPELSMALFIGLLAAVSIKLPSVQLASVSIGLLLGEAYFRYMHRRHVGLELGSLLFQDRWWLTVYMTRILSIMIICMLKIVRSGLSRMTSGMKSGLKNKKWTAWTKKGS